MDQDSLYDENVSSVIFVEFSTAAFRFGHTLVASLIRLYRNLAEERLDKHFFDTDVIRKSPKMGEIFYRSFAIESEKSRANQLQRYQIFQSESNQTFSVP